MAHRGSWIAVDIIGSNQGKDIFVHSAGGAKIAKNLRRCANALGLDRKREAVVRAVIEQALQGRAIPAVEGLHVETHQVDAADGTPVGLLVWVGDQAPEPRPVYNGWVLDFQVMTTRTSGDNPSLIGDGRAADEERHVQHLFTYLNPDDAWSLLGGYSDALAGEEGQFIESHWSLRPEGQWVHFWSSGRLHLLENGDRLLYGLTIQLAERELFEFNISSLVRYTAATLLLVEARSRFPLTTAGRLAPLGETRINQVLAQVDLDVLSNSHVDDPFEQKIEIDGKPFLASTFALHSSRENHGDPVAIILLSPDSDH